MIEPARISEAMKLNLALLLPCFLASTLAGEQNQLTPEETAAGWKLLFDGKTTQGWRSYQKQTFPKRGWVVEDGWLRCVSQGRGGDIVTVDQFNDFEFSWEWRIPAKANNGVKYLVNEKRSGGPGHEYQMIDDATVKPGKSATASFYDVLPPAADKPLKAPGEINQSRIVIQGNHVEHWLNGARVLEYELGSEAVKAAVANSKFKGIPDFGTKVRGPLLLTDHGTDAYFRNLKIRDLPPRP
jgi:hypothetical protein